jgi:hypothetical protein
VTFSDDSVALYRLCCSCERFTFGQNRDLIEEMMMNWVFGAYSNVYSTAMMQKKDVSPYFADAKMSEGKGAGRIARLFGRA